MIDLLNRFAYVICMFFSVGLFYFQFTSGNKNSLVKRISSNVYKFLFLFLILYWSTLLGSQDNVGSDYPTYFGYFEKGCPKMYYKKYEIGFAYITDFIFNHKFSPQLGFIVFSLIQSICMCKFILDCDFERPDLFLLIYFCCATSFVNSQNALRQYTAMYIFLLGISFLKKRCKGIKNVIYAGGGYLCIVILASLFHQSAILLLSMLFIKFLLHSLGKKRLFLLMGISLFVCIKGMDRLIVPFVKLTPYAAYLDSVYFIDGNRNSILNIATKLIYLPFYFHFLFHGYDFFTAEKDKFYINLGICSFCIKIMSMSSFFLGRFAMYFDCISYIPLYYYGIWLLKNRRMKKYEKISWLFLLFCVVLAPYFAKTIAFPSGEYMYKSVLF